MKAIELLKEMYSNVEAAVYSRELEQEAVILASKTNPKKNFITFLFDFGSPEFAPRTLSGLVAIRFEIEENGLHVDDILSRFDGLFRNENAQPDIYAEMNEIDNRATYKY